MECRAEHTVGRHLKLSYTPTMSEPFFIGLESLSSNPSISLWTIFFKKGIFINIYTCSAFISASPCFQTHDSSLLSTNELYPHHYQEKFEYVTHSSSLREFVGLVLQNFTGHMLGTSLKKVLFPICKCEPYVVPKVLSKCKTPMVLSEHCMEMWLFPLSQNGLAQHFLMSILPISEPISQLEIFFSSERKDVRWTTLCPLSF